MITMIASKTNCIIVAAQWILFMERDLALSAELVPFVYSNKIHDPIPNPKVTTKRKSRVWRLSSKKIIRRVVNKAKTASTIKTPATEIAIFLSVTGESSTMSRCNLVGFCILCYLWCQSRVYSLY